MLDKILIKINPKTFFLSVVLFTLFRFCSPVFINGTQFAPFYTMLSKAFALMIFCWYFFVNKKLSIPFLIVFSFFFVRFVITAWYAPANIMRVIMAAYPVMAFICILEIFMKKKSKIIMEAFMMCLRVMCIANALQSLIIPNAFEHYYLIGGENQIVFTYILSVVLEKVCSKMGDKRIKCYIVLLTLSILRIFSAGNILGWFGFLLINFYYRKERLVQGSTIFINFCIAWCLIVIVRIQNIFEWLIVGVLHKNLTFTNRTIIWDNALKSIKASPILGYGVQGTVNLFYTYIERIDKPTVNSWFSAHNQVIQTLYESGILSMIPIILFIIIVFKRLDNNCHSYVYSVMVAGIIGILISMMAEAPGWDSLLILLTSAYYINIISDRYNINQQKR